MRREEGERAEGQEKDEHRTSNVQHRTSNEKMKQRAEDRGQMSDVRCQISEDGVFGGVIRPEAQLKSGRWEMLCPVCGKAGEWLWTPESYVAPPNAYAMAKYSQEMQALTFGRRYGIPSVALRYSIVQGPRQSFYNAYSGACRIFSLNYYFGKAPTLYEDGLQCRDFVNIHDVVRANIMALEDERMDYEIYNVGGGKAYTIEEFAGIVKEQMSEVRGQKTEDSRLRKATPCQGGQKSGGGNQRTEDSRLRKATPCQGGQRTEVGSRSADYPSTIFRTYGAGANLRRLKGKEGGLPEAKVPGLYRFGDTRNACSDISKIRERWVGNRGIRLWIV